MTSPLRLVLTHRLSPVDAAQPSSAAAIPLWLTADERTKSRHRFTASGMDLHLQLPRGTVLHHGDLLSSADGQGLVRVIAQPEPVLTVTGSSLALMQAAYHLGNRHVPVEIAPTYLRLAPDPVLRNMLIALGMTVVDDRQPFQPASGAYDHPHAHAHHG